MALVNAIVNSPDDLEFRMHLRNELFLMGMDGVTDVRRTTWWPPRRTLPAPNPFSDDRVALAACIRCSAKSQTSTWTRSSTSSRTRRSPTRRR